MRRASPDVVVIVELDIVVGAVVVGAVPVSVPEVEPSPATAPSSPQATMSEHGETTSNARLIIGNPAGRTPARPD